MEVILLERVEKLGQMGDVVNVKPGYARNYLLPQRKALRATKTNLERFGQERTQIEAASLERRDEAEAVVARLKGLTCTLLRQASENAQLYGSVSARDVAQGVSDKGVSVTRNQIQLERPIKQLGIHPVRIVLHPEVIVSIKVNVARSAEEAEAQAAAATTGLPMPSEIQTAADTAPEKKASSGEEPPRERNGAESPAESPGKSETAATPGDTGTKAKNGN